MKPLFILALALAGCAVNPPMPAGTPAVTRDVADCLWQLAHAPPPVLLWSNDDTAQLLTLWQASQPVDVAICRAGFPVAARPLWQFAHVPIPAV